MYFLISYLCNILQLYPLSLFFSCNFGFINFLKVSFFAFNPTLEFDLTSFTESSKLDKEGNSSRVTRNFKFAHSDRETSDSLSKANLIIFNLTMTLIKHKNDSSKIICSSEFIGIELEMKEI